MTDPRPLPCRRQLLQAILVAVVCALAFLREGVLPTRAVVPFPPERYEPLHSEVLARGRITQADIDRGSTEFGDKYNQSLAWDRIEQDRLRSGELPLWTRDIAGGVPFVPQMAQVYQPWNLLLLLPVPSVGMYGPWWFLHLVLWGVFAWWFLRRIGVHQNAALVGLVVAVLGFWTQARVHHNVILSAALPLFPMLTIVDGAFRGGGMRAGRVALLASCVGVSWSGGFAPVSLQASLLVAAWAVLGALRARAWRPLLPIGAAMALGAVLALPQMGPTLLAARESSRDPATPELLASLGLTWRHLYTLLWPDLLHWPAPTLHDGIPSWPAWAALDLLPDAKARALNFAETAFAIGIPGALLALGALARRDIVAWFFAAVAVLAFGLATASWPFLELSAVVPGARSGDLRRFLFLVSVALCILAALGADRWIARGRPPLGLVLLAALAAVLSAWPLLEHLAVASDLDAFRRLYAERFAGTYDVPGAGPVQVTPEMALAGMQARPLEAADNLAMLLWTYGRSLVVALAAVAVLLRVPARVGALALGGLAAVELLAAGAGTIVPVPVGRVLALPDTLAPVAEATRIAGDAAAPRPRLARLERPGVAPRSSRLLPPNLGAFFGLEDLSAYSPLPKRRMEELFVAIEPARGGSPSVALGGAGVSAFQSPQSLRHPLLDLLGCRFVLSARDDVATDDRLVDRTPALTPRPFRLFERTSTLPRATFVDRVELVPDHGERLRRLADPARDVAHVAILEDPASPPADGDGDPDADVTVLRHTDQEVAVAVTNREPGYLRLADPWDDGWTAVVDGQRRTVWIADHYLRAVHLEPGTHEVVFRYDGLKARAWPWVGLAALLAVALLGVAGALGARRVRRSEQALGHPAG